MSVKSKLAILVLLITALPLIGFGVVSYFKTRDILTVSIQESLQSIVDIKADKLERYIDSTASLGQSIARTSAFQTYVNRLAEGAPSEAVTAQVSDLLRATQEANWGKYHHVFVLDRSKRIVVSPNHGFKAVGSPSAHLNEDVSGNPWAMQALASGEIQVSDYSSWSESDHNHQMLFLPVRDASNTVQAVIGFELSIGHEVALLSEGVNLGQTGRVFLATDRGVPISEKGIESAAPLQTDGIIEALRDGTSTGVRLNDDGVEVVDLYAKDEKYPWVLVAEVETTEAFAPINNLQKFGVIALAVTGALALLLSLLFANYVIRPVERLTRQMEKVSLGEFDVEIDSIDRNDEIGELVRAFDRVVTSLRLVLKRYIKLKQSDSDGADARRKVA